MTSEERAAQELMREFAACPRTLHERLLRGTADALAGTQPLLEFIDHSSECHRFLEFLLVVQKQCGDLRELEFADLAQRVKDIEVPRFFDKDHAAGRLAVLAYAARRFGHPFKVARQSALFPFVRGNLAFLAQMTILKLPTELHEALRVEPDQGRVVLSLGGATYDPYHTYAECPLDESATGAIKDAISAARGDALDRRADLEVAIGTPPFTSVGARVIARRNLLAGLSGRSIGLAAGAAALAILTDRPFSEHETVFSATYGRDGAIGGIDEAPAKWIAVRSAPANGLGVKRAVILPQHSEAIERQDGDPELVAC